MHHALRIRATLIWTTLLILTPQLAPDAGAQVSPSIVVTLEPTPIRDQREGKGTLLMTVETGTVLEAIDREGDWFWVLLPRDLYGSTRTGWVSARLVEIKAQGDTMTSHVLEGTGSSSSYQADAEQLRAQRQKMDMAITTLDEASRGQTAATDTTQTNPPAQAGTRPAAGPMSTRPQRGSFQGFGGLTFGSRSAGLFGAALGGNFTPDLQLIIEIGHLRNILPDTTERLILQGAQAFAADLTRFADRPVTLLASSELSATYGIAGLRYLIPVSTPHAIRPYVNGGFGAARLNPDVSLTVNGDDVSSQVFASGFVPAEESETEPLASFGGGVTLPLLDFLSVDFGYRYLHIFTTDALQVNRLYFGVSLQY